MQPRALPRLASLGLWSQGAAREQGSWAFCIVHPCISWEFAVPTALGSLGCEVSIPTGFETSVCWDPLLVEDCVPTSCSGLEKFQSGSQIVSELPQPLAQRHRAAARRTDRPSARWGRIGGPKRISEERPVLSTGPPSQLLQPGKYLHVGSEAQVPRPQLERKGRKNPNHHEGRLIPQTLRGLGPGANNTQQSQRRLSGPSRCEKTTSRRVLANKAVVPGPCPKASGSGPNFLKAGTCRNREKLSLKFGKGA